MKRFSYYLFENFDADEQAENPQNPRSILNPTTDPVLSRIAQFPPHCCPANAFDDREIAPLITAGALRKEDGMLLFDTPVFLREDAVPLRNCIASQAAQLAEQMMPAIPRIRACCEEIANGFPVEINLYHILCGMVFDGLFFDYLTRHGALATSRIHPSGLDYLSVIYEKCEELDAFSDGLLCSYNRFTDGTCSLQSFGDANGDRFDFYRYSRLLESGKLPPRFGNVPRLPDKAYLLSQVRELVEHGSCDPDVLVLLTKFGYVANGKPCVPVFTRSALAAAEQIEGIVEESIGDAFIRALTDVPNITAARHGVSPAEIANELYHILFGSVNEELVARGIVASPPHIPGEGRYLRCIWLDL